MTNSELSISEFWRGRVLYVVPIECIVHCLKRCLELQLLLTWRSCTTTHAQSSHVVYFLLQQPVCVWLGQIGMHRWHPSILTDVHSSDPPQQIFMESGCLCQIMVERTTWQVTGSHDPILMSIISCEYLGYSCWQRWKYE